MILTILYIFGLLGIITILSMIVVGFFAHEHNLKVYMQDGRVMVTLKEDVD